MKTNTKRILNKTNISLLIILASIASIIMVFNNCISTRLADRGEETGSGKDPVYLYGICIDSLNVTSGEVGRGENLSNILNKYGIDAGTIDVLTKRAKDIFDLRGIRQGNTYNAMTTMDSIQKLQYLVYEHSNREYVVFGFKDSVQVWRESKEVITVRRIAAATIESSLWNAMTSNDINPVLAMELSEIYAWTIDFFGLQKGDSFNVIYDELFVDDKSIGTGTIWGAWFDHGGKRYYAVRYEQDGIKGYWDEKGVSLKKAFLKAPLKFSRISSKFSNGRMHPVLRIVRPHHGVDYAAPTGTPVSAVANGVVISKGWGGGGGNTVKIKHSGDLVTGYLHLSKYANGIAVGTRVSQGQIIGYVGNTGVSTGPHLDFRIWKKGKPVDPLKMASEPGEPINAKNKAGFETGRDLLLAELESGIPMAQPADTVNLAALSFPMIQNDHDKSAR